MDTAFGFILIPVGLFLGHASNMVAHRPRKELHCNLPAANVDLISGALPFGRLWYGGPMHYQTKSATQPFQLLT